MKAEDIVDQQTFEAWLEEHRPSRQACVWLAARSALCALPVAWNWNGSPYKVDLTRITVLRRLCLSDLASLTSISERMKLAAVAADAAGAEAYAVRASAGATKGVAAYAADAAAYAADAVVYDPENAVLATTGSAAAAALGAAIYSELSQDCQDVEQGLAGKSAALWRIAPPLFAAIWEKIASTESSPAMIGNPDGGRGTTGSDWWFWIDWYEDVIAGRPRNIPMMEEIALDVDWDNEPAHVLAQIDVIATKYRTTEQVEQDKNEAVQIDVFRATLFDFSYDALEGVMRAVPLARDWKHLDDPDLLAAFLKDAEELREDLQLFCDALAAEGAAMQGAGIVRTYCTALLSELKKAEAVQNLQVGKLVQYGRMIENARLDPATQKEFGLLAPALEDNGRAVLDLMRNHFARTLSRFAELRDVGVEDDATHWEVLQGFRDLVRAIQSDDAPDRPPLAKEDAVVLSDIMESVERQLRAMDGTDDDSVLDSLRREVNFELAKLGATIAIFRERAVDSEKDLGEAADVALKWQKRGLGLWGIVKMLKKGLGIE